MARRYWLLGLALFAAIAVVWAGQGDRARSAIELAPAAAQAPRISAAAATSPTPHAPAPTIPLLQPAPKPSIPIPTAPPIAPASTAPPLPLVGNYTDPAGRFKVGVLQDFKVSPLAGSVLVESGDGQLAYAVVAQSQPYSGAIGLTPGTDADNLAKVAATVFQRGEGFQPGVPQPEAGGGVVLDWTGSLTIAGKAQPVGGVVLVRPTARQILLLIVTATETGAARVPGAIAALAPTLQ